MNTHPSVGGNHAGATTLHFTPTMRTARPVPVVRSQSAWPVPVVRSQSAWPVPVVRSQSVRTERPMGVLARPTLTGSAGRPVSAHRPAPRSRPAQQRRPVVEHPARQSWPVQPGAPSWQTGRRSQAVVLRRRRLLVAVGVALLTLTGVGVASASSGRSTGPTTVVRVVMPGESLWSIAREVKPHGDVRPLVAKLRQQVVGPTLQPGDELLVPVGN